MKVETDDLIEKIRERMGSTSFELCAVVYIIIDYFGSV